jgi:hypothetical protein
MSTGGPHLSASLHACQIHFLWRWSMGLADYRARLCLHVVGSSYHPFPIPCSATRSWGPHVGHIFPLPHGDRASSVNGVHNSTFNHPTEILVVRPYIVSVEVLPLLYQKVREDSRRHNREREITIAEKLSPSFSLEGIDGTSACVYEESLGCKEATPTTNSALSAMGPQHASLL